jgi:RNA polymerase sigma-70 factor (ECF subfamily)
MPPTQEVTEMLVAWSNGDRSALEKLIPLVHDELHRLAHRYMNRERPGHMLQPTALVNEAYLRLVDSSHVRWQNRAHFFAVSSQLMRRILVDFARSRNYLKRGGNMVQVSLDKVLEISPEQDADLVALDVALNALESIDERKARVVELRFFGGLKVEETAEVLKVSPVTVMRDWRLAKVWLLREMSPEKSDEA